ncbi:MAG: hypothetical protein V2B18_08400 [Pseudomonadota bacterium]
MESEKAAFMGKITAGVTHEVKNVLAIIKESAGLLEDIICYAKEGAPPPRDKFLRTLTRITEQVARGVDLSNKLNAFAHVPDDKTASVDLNQALVQTEFLSRRFARLKGMTLNVVPYDGRCTVVTDPLAVQMILFECISLLMDQVEAGAVIHLSIEENQGKRIVIQAVGASDQALAQFASDPCMESVRLIAERLSMSVRIGGPPPCIIVGM